jgi:hypothetical protein
MPDIIAITKFQELCIDLFFSRLEPVHTYTTDSPSSDVLTLHTFLGSAGEDTTYYILNPNYRGNIAMNTGTNTIATVLSSLITVLSAGPAVSLYGSPIKSPTTAIA